MARITIEDCLEKVSNKYALVVVAAKRAKQLYKGAKPLVDNRENKNIVLALREIAVGKITFQEPLPMIPTDDQTE